MAKSDFRFSCELRVRWGECDAQGIVFNAQYMNFIEVAQAEYFRNLGMRIYDADSRRYFDLATVKATLEYMAPARVDDMLEIYMGVARIGNSSLTLKAEMYLADGAQPIHRAEVIYVDYDAELGKARAVPDDVRRLIADFERSGEIRAAGRIHANGRISEGL